MTSLILKKVLKEFGFFLNNFTPENVNIELLKGEIYVKDIANFTVKKARCSSVKIKLSLFNISHDPIIIDVGRIDAEIAEPVDITPMATPLADKKRKRFEKLKAKQAAAEKKKETAKPEKPKKRGLIDNVIDGATINVAEVHIRLGTLGPYKKEGLNVFSPPTVVVDIKGVRTFATNSLWQVVDLKKSRVKNVERTEVSTFRKLEIGGISVSLEDRNTTAVHTMIDDMPVSGRITQRKTILGGTLLAAVVDVEINSIKVKLDQDILLNILSVANSIPSMLARKVAVPTPPATPVLSASNPRLSSSSMTTINPLRTSSPSTPLTPSSPMTPTKIGARTTAPGGEPPPTTGDPFDDKVYTLDRMKQLLNVGLAQDELKAFVDPWNFSTDRTNITISVKELSVELSEILIGTSIRTPFFEVYLENVQAKIFPPMPAAEPVPHPRHYINTTTAMIRLQSLAVSDCSGGPYADIIQGLPLGDTKAQSYFVNARIALRSERDPIMCPVPFKFFKTVLHAQVNGLDIQANTAPVGQLLDFVTQLGKSAESVKNAHFEAAKDEPTLQAAIEADRLAAEEARARDSRDGGAFYNGSIHLEAELNNLNVILPPAPGKGPKGLDEQVWRLQIPHFIVTCASKQASLRNPSSILHLMQFPNAPSDFSVTEYPLPKSVESGPQYAHLELKVRGLNLQMETAFDAGYQYVIFPIDIGVGLLLRNGPLMPAKEIRVDINIVKVHLAPDHLKYLMSVTERITLPELPPSLPPVRDPLEPAANGSALILLSLGKVEIALKRNLSTSLYFFDEHAVAEQFKVLAPPPLTEESKILVSLGVSSINMALETHPAAQVVKVLVGALEVTESMGAKTNRLVYVREGLTTPVVAVRMEMATNAASNIMTEGLDRDAISERMSQALTDTLFKRGLSSALMQKNITGAGSVYLKVHDICISVAPTPFLALKPFIIIPPSDDSSSDLDMDVEVNNLSAHVEDTEGRELTAVIPNLKFVRRSGNLREALMVSVKDLSYHGQQERGGALAPLSVMAKIERCVDGTDANIQVKMDNTIKLSIMPSEFTLLQNVVAQLKPLMSEEQSAEASKLVDKLESQVVDDGPGSSVMPPTEEVILKRRVLELQHQLADAQAKLAALRSK